MIFQPEAIAEDVKEEEKESGTERSEDSEDEDDDEERKDKVPEVVLERTSEVKLRDIRKFESQETVTDVKFSDSKIVDLENILDKLENIYGDSLFSGNMKMTKIEASPKISLL